MKFSLFPSFSTGDRTPLSLLETFQVAQKAYTLVANAPRLSDPQEARIQMGEIGQHYIEYLESKGIPVNFHGFNGVDWSNVPLVLGNHQAFGLEALLIHTMVPDATVMVKAELLRNTLGLGKGMATTNPIAIERVPEYARRLRVLEMLEDIPQIGSWAKGKKDQIKQEQRKLGTGSLRQAIEAQKTIIRDKGRVVVFPEGTRKKGSEEPLLPWIPSYYSGAYSAMKHLQGDQYIGLITAHTERAFPNTMERMITLCGEAYRTRVDFILDLVKYNPHQKVSEFNEIAYEYVKQRLMGAYRGDFPSNAN